MADGPLFTFGEMLESARRELRMREKAYPRWVSAGKMTARQAARETALQGAIVDVLERLAKGDLLL